MNNKPKSEDKPATAEPTGEELQIKGTEVSEGKNQTRLFQTSAYVKEWLTKAQALEHKLYWAEEA